jgi:hypothetical protein
MTGITKVEIDDRDDMSIMQANTWQEIYRDFKVGLAVNDGRFVTQVDDRPDIGSVLEKISR